MNYDPYYHHRRSIRFKGYDYSSEGYYFITMCSLKRKNIFADLSVGVGLAPTRKERSLSEEPVTLGSIIGSFKSLCVTKNLKNIKENSLQEYGKIWQRDYYEHIIRNKSELDKIRKYIKSNPYNWLKDQKNIRN